MVYLVVCFGNVQDKAHSSVISLIKSGLKKTKVCLFEKRYTSILYIFFL